MQVSDEAVPVYDPVEYPPPDDSVVVAPYEVVSPYTNPRVVGASLPTVSMEPLRVAPVVEIDEAAAVLTVGGVSAPTYIYTSPLLLKTAILFP